MHGVTLQYMELHYSAWSCITVHFKEEKANKSKILTCLIKTYAKYLFMKVHGVTLQYMELHYSTWSYITVHFKKKNSK